MDACKINLITKTYNEARLVPYFFRHYDQFVDHYYIWDNLSTDGTKELLLKNPKVTVFDLESKTFDDYEHREFKNNAWKDFKDCDWIFNIDFDEFLYHNNLLYYLQYCKNENFKILKPEGYQMFAEILMISKEQITDFIKTGIREPNYDKCVIFDPNADLKYSFGAHECYTNEPIFKSEIKLLHYKVLGIGFISDILKRNDRLSERNKSERLSFWPDEPGDRFNPFEYYEFLKLNAKEVI